MFLDKVQIKIKAGNGGNGHVSFFRDKLTMRGGPDGGDGGRGGNVVFIGTTREDNLVNFRYTKKFHAGDGKHGGTTHKNGKYGEVMIVPVPLGTRILKENGELLADIIELDQQFIALKGGGGGKGNAFFATAKKQTPNFSQMGVETKEYIVKLELNTIADIGLVGFPNVGKSTLLASTTRANPKIANYHFTTLHPNIGVANVYGDNIIIADVPGLIEGASQGTGLGHDFLKHLRRVRLLVHVIDISEQEGRDALTDLETINNELMAFDPELGAKPQIIALNKCDVATKEAIAKFKKTKCKSPVFEIMAAIGEGVPKLLEHAHGALQKLPKASATQAYATLEEIVDKNTFKVEISDGEFFVTGPFIDNLIRGVVLTDTESNSYFQRRLEESGIISEMKQKGLKTGDIVHIGEVEFEWVD